MSDELRGHRGLVREKLEEWGVRVWSEVRVVNDAGSVFEGVILPRSENFDEEHFVIKMATGYNVGIAVNRVRDIIETGYREVIYKIPEQEFPHTPDLPDVTLLGTGGTIASRLDYRTGAVIPPSHLGNCMEPCPSSPTSAISRRKRLQACSAKTWAGRNTLNSPLRSVMRSRGAPTAS